MGRAIARACLALALIVTGLSDLNAAIMWSWISEGEGKTFAGTLTTDGDYSQTQNGSDLVTFTVLSFDSWFLDGTDLINGSVFALNDWQTDGMPNGQISKIAWSPTDQAIDPITGLESSTSSVAVSTFPSDGHAVLSIVNAQNTNFDPSVLRNQIGQHPGFGNPDFDLGFIATSTVFTPVPVPEPSFCVGGAMIGMSIFVWMRRVKAVKRPGCCEVTG